MKTRKLLILAVLLLAGAARAELTAAEQEELWEQAQQAQENKNYGIALELYQQLAEAGHREAPERIGLMYEKGEGQPQDFVAAKNWFTKAILAGNKNGYGLIGYLYREGGPGLPKDLLHACVYYSKAGGGWLEGAEQVCPTELAAPTKD